MTKHRSTLPRIFPVFLIASTMWAQSGGPVINSVKPNSVPANSAATQVTISGSNFANGATISFTPPGGAATTITPSQVQAAQIAATIPATLLTTAGTAEIAIQSGGTLTSQLPFTITQVATTTALASSMNPSVYGQSVSFTATVTPSTATGNVAFKDGTATLCNGTISTSGSSRTAGCSTATLTAGAHSITAVYAGDTNDLTSTSSVLTQNVSVATPTVAIISSANPSAVGQSVTLIASIMPSVATGGITFKDGSTTLGAGTISSAGTARLVVAPGFSSGAHSLTASYAGDANDHAATSATLSEVVDQPANATATSLAASVNPSNLGQSVTLTATLSPSAATGNVTFYDGVNILGIAAPTGGQASLTTNLLPFGAQSIQAYFGLGANYGASTSAALSQTVNALPASGFAAASPTGASGSGFAVVVGDFNGDGKADFVAPGNGGVQVVLGNGDGTFQSPVFYSGGSGEFVATGDFNGDGKADLVVPNLGFGTVNVFLGNGDGTFQTAVSYPAGVDAFFVGVADFNGDGKADLAVSSNQSGAVSVLLGNGDGTFQAAAGYAGGEDNPLWSVVPGDFNGDGKVDLLTGDSGGVNVLLGNGDGTFQPPLNSTDGNGNPLFFAVGDFNGDGRLDFAASANLGNANVVHVFLGNGDGTFAPPVSYAVGTQGGPGSFDSVVVGDFNGDGNFDIAVPNSGSGNVSVLLGNGDGTFQPALNYAVGTSPQAIGVADFNGDNRTDLIVSGSGKFSVLLGIPAGLTFTPLAIKSSGALGGFVAGAAVSATFTATGGSPAYTWSATGMPASLSLNAATGQLTGTAPAIPGNYSFALTVSDAEIPAASASTTVTLSVLGFTTAPTLPSGTTATPYSLNFTAAGGTPPYAFSSAGVPAGLTLASSGFLSGTPKSTGTTFFTVQVTDSTNLAVSGPFSLTVASGVQPIQVTGTALPDGTTTKSYSQTLEAQNGKPPYTWTVLGGALPGGLVLSSAGTISGTPTATGLATFTARATDSAGGFAAGVFTIRIVPAPLQITTAPLPKGIAGLPYGPQPINATGGFSPYTFALTQGSLPAPLTFTNGQINGGTAAAPGIFPFTVTVTDAAGSTASGSFSLVIEPNQPDLILSQGSVAFTIVAGTAVLPAAARVTVGSSVPAALNYNVQVTPASATWLNVAASGTTPGTLAIALDPVNAPQLPNGNYQASVTVSCAASGPCSASPHTIAVSLVVSSPAPQLSLNSNFLSFSSAGAGGQTLSQSLGLQNTGGGTIAINSVTAADPWVTFGLFPTTLSAGQLFQLTVNANTASLAPGYYQTTITVTTDAGSAAVTVTLLIAANATMTLNPAGSQFLAVAGNAPGNTSGSFLVSVSGSSMVNWTATLLANSTPVLPTWLTLNTAGGSSTSANPGKISFSINPTAASLTAQTYYATIEVDAPANEVAGPMQYYLVVLNVAPASSITQPNPDPAGLIFISTGAGSLPTQTVQLFASSTGIDYSADSDSPSWLSVGPASGTTSAASPAQTGVSVNTAGLSPGVFRGGVNYSIAGQVRTVNVTLIVAAPAAASSGINGKATSPGCTATQIIPTQTGLVDNFSLPTAWATPIQITVTDDCGKPVTDATVTATFSNDDPPLVLTPVDTSSGVYSIMWTPNNTASQVTISALASAPGFTSQSILITGQVTRGAAPILNLNGTLNAFISKLGAPVAPGMIVQIYGSNMAAQTTISSTIPLTTSLNRTSVAIGGIQAPLYYVSPGQINAQVPFEVPLGSQYVVVFANGTQTTAAPIQIATDSPGIAVYPGGGIQAEHADGTLVTETSPAAPNEYVVFFVSGMGATDNTVATGTATPGSPYSRPKDPPTLTLNGVNVPLSFAGLTPTLVGLYQVNFQVPADMPNGDLQLVLTQTGGQSNSTILPVHN